MFSHQLHHQIARATGESVGTIRSRGFGLLRLAVPLAQPDPGLCLACPGCGSNVALNTDNDTLPEWAECKECDAAYPYHDAEVFLPDAAFAECP
jgi:hypothetical protein